MQMRSTGVFAGALVLAGFVACNSSPDHSKDPGRVDVQLVATGTDNARYRLPAGSSVDLFSETPQFDMVTILDGNGDFVDILMPPGTYQATLIKPDGTTGPDWTLEHVDSNGTLLNTVDATLLTALPVTVTVTANDTTHLVFSFRIPTGGTVTFDRGTVEVSLEVTTETAASYSFDSVMGPLTVASRGVAGPNAEQLGAVTPPVETTGLTVEFGGPLTGGWIEFGGAFDGVSYFTTACAPPNLTIRQAAGHTGFVDFMSEVGHGSDSFSLFGPASLCIEDDGVNNNIRVRVSRRGAATSNSFSGLGSDDLWFRAIFRAQLPHRAYDYVNHTLDLAQLMADTSNALPLIQGSLTLRPVVDGSINTTSWYGSQLTGTMNFSFEGH